MFTLAPFEMSRLTISRLLYKHARYNIDYPDLVKLTLFCEFIFALRLISNFDIFKCPFLTLNAKAVNPALLHITEVF